MLKQLRISNYRLFDELHIPDLGQVNLIAGKNNTGKTALLEALRIWAAGMDSSVVNHVLKSRGQFTPDLIDSYRWLFNNGVNDKTLTINNLSIKKQLAGGKQQGGYRIFGKMPIINLSANVTPDFPQDKSIFIPFNNHFPLQNLWEKIVLTPLENDILEILRIIEPRIQRIDVKDEKSRVLLSGDSGPVPLKSLGDGINRMLWVAVALVSSKDTKLLLIDEFEAGLHHSVQEMLWKKIFFYAQHWKIQIFATTHSLDTVQTFQSVADRPENQGKGKFFRLQRNKKGEIEAVTYDEEELATAIEFDLETR